MTTRRIGSLLTALVVVLAGGVVLLNVDRDGLTTADRPEVVAEPPTAIVSNPALSATAGVPPRKTPIGEEVERNGMRIAAVWRPALPTELEPTPRPGAIHLEARIHATTGSPHGFAVGEWVPYAKVAYELKPERGGASTRGVLTPIVDVDGPHYGANLAPPQPGPHRLTLRIEPPSASGMVRSVDSVMGVAPWWEPFAVRFDWSYPPK